MRTHITRCRHLGVLLAAIVLSAATAAAQAPMVSWEDAEEAADWDELADDALPSLDPASPADPLVEAIRETRPTTPAELLRAAKTLADLGHPEPAREYLQRFLATDPDDAQFVALSAELGSAVFFVLGSRRELAPEGAQVADRALAALERHHRDPQHLADLAADLSDPAAEVRGRALEGLRRAGAAAVEPLLAVLAEPARSEEHAAARAALARLGGDAIDPLVAALAADEDALVAQVAQVLGAARAPRAALYLYAPALSGERSPSCRQAAGEALARLLGDVPEAAEAARALKAEAEEYFHGRRTLAEDHEGQVTVWTWDAAAGVPRQSALSPDEAAIAHAVRLAGDAVSIVPADAAVRVLYRTARLEQAALAAGLAHPVAGDDPAVAELVAAGTDALEEVLRLALGSGHVGAAAQAARLLGEHGSASELLLQGAEPSVLVRALRHGDRRARFAAAEAVVRLEPSAPFAGSSHLVETLSHFAATRGERRVLLAGPRTGELRRLGGFLAPLGVVADTATNGRDALTLALASPDYEWILVSAVIDRPPADVFVQQVRRDARTADLPVGLLAPEGRFQRARRLAERDPLVEAFVAPTDAESALWQAALVESLPGRRFVPFEERQQQAAAALTMLAELGSRRGVFDLARVEPVALAALRQPQLAEQAIAVLEHMGTAESQRALVDLAARPRQPLAIRQAALAAFRESSQRFGILLTTTQIQRQYDQYNRTPAEDETTRTILGLILDVIEAPTMARREMREAP